MHISVSSWVFLAISATCALAYGLYFLNRPESLLRALVKAGMMGALAAAFWGGPPPLVIAFTAAALGDFFLAFEKRTWALPLGMVAFLIMQVGYIGAFFAIWLLSGDGSPIWPRYALMVLTALVIATFLVALWREPGRKGSAVLAVLAVLGAMAIGAALPFTGVVGMFAMNNSGPVGTWPSWATLGGVYVVGALLMWLRRDLGLVKLAGMIYAAVIVEMAFVSFWAPWAGWMAMLGALSFLVSDGVLSWELFRMAPDAPARRITSHVVWWTYAAAQGLIALGLVNAARVSFN